jgi:hypothetical protein
MKRQIVSAAFGAWLLVAGQGVAQVSQGVVVELYTSQGCSSCPPADALLRDLAGQPGVIPLALHVDYWDYIGWEDRFANPAFTARQKAYAKAVQDKMVYTPQMIVGGVDRVVGNEPQSVARAIKAKAAMVSPVRIFVDRQGDKATIRVESDAALGSSFVQLVRYTPSAKVAIERGENAGLTVSYANIVTSWQRLADWSGSGPLQIKADVPGNEPMVVIVQRSGPAEILAAAVVK